MKWFDKWFKKKCRKTLESIRADECQSDRPPTAVDSSNNSISANGLSFKLYAANGGHVVEFQKYRDHNPNVRSDQNPYSLYVIPADKDLGEGLTHIMTIELLKQ